MIKETGECRLISPRNRATNIRDLTITTAKKLPFQHVSALRFCEMATTLLRMPLEIIKQLDTYFGGIHPVVLQLTDNKL
jgi:Mg2+/citrate symporter